MDSASTSATTIVIFGGTGDLAQKKLLPALFHLYRQGYLPKDVHILGVSFDKYSPQSYGQFVTTAITAGGTSTDPAKLTDFIARVDYLEGSFEQADLYPALAERLAALDTKMATTCSNKLFYLAVPPKLYETIFQQLAASGLTIPCGDADGWTRILVEKPFGRDLATAQALDQKLGTLFREEQIFRIDHYLAKETVQNIITFRFANALFEPVWDFEDIEQVHILVAESIGVGERGSFYEDIGALRDVGQNHLLQLLALIAMEDPGKLDAAAIRQARTQVLANLKPLTTADIQQSIIRGQYAGYRAEQDVAATSQTETYFKLTAHIDNKRWAGVPFILESGKKLAEHKVEITITFKEPDSCVSPSTDSRKYQNVLTIRVQPNEGISLLFWAKKPGLAYELEPRQLSFSYQNDGTDILVPNAYEKVLYDCIRGDQTLFASTDEVTAAWKFITPILEQWEQIPLHEYEPGSTGPKIEGNQ